MKSRLKIGDLVIHEHKHDFKLGIVTKLYADLNLFANDPCTDQLSIVCFDGRSFQHCLSSSLRKVNP